MSIGVHLDSPHANSHSAYGLLDVLTSHFQTELNITAANASGLSAAYFGAYFLW